MLFKRQVFEEIYQHFQKKEITVLLGPRQVGKTTLLKQSQARFNQDGVLAKRIFYFNLDVVTDREHFADQAEFIRFLKSRLGKEKLFILVDEAQRIKNCGRFFKGIYDLDLNIKLVLSGSASLDLKAEVQESLAGRKKIFYLLPLTFPEFLATSFPFELGEFKLLAKADKQSIWREFENYLLFGGYPKLVKANFSAKQDYLKDIFSSYVEKDIVNFLRVKSADGFIRLVRVLARQAGQLINLQELSNTLMLDRKTLENYLFYLEETFVGNRIRPFFKNYRKEITKLPKFYFYDLGLRNFACEDFKNLNKRQDKGMLWENFVFLSLKRLADKLRFWRTAEGNEVDFVVEKPNGELFACEVKSGNLNKARISRGYQNFIDFYQPKKALVVNPNILETAKRGQTQIIFCPPFLADRYL